MTTVVAKTLVQAYAVPWDDLVNVLEPELSDQLSDLDVRKAFVDAVLGLPPDVRRDAALARSRGGCTWAEAMVDGSVLVPCTECPRSIVISLPNPFKFGEEVIP